MIKMKSIEEFIREWYKTEGKQKYRGIKIKSGIVFSNFFTIDESEYDGSYVIDLYISINKSLLNSGYIYLDDILGVFEINE